ncbi:MAG: NADH:ubiquinone reductase (Na(+)-transporting) subunit B [Deltaproteobacteria bacterium]|nr:NADH:ubiquinone reductase (Na(+)-transporting) subunit B [Deltaproteobacteria bacterium]
MLRKFLDKQGKAFEKGGRFEKLYPLYEAIDTFLYTPGATSKKPSFVRDAVDLKRMMITVVVAMTPAILLGIYNAGYQANLAISPILPDVQALNALTNWQTTLFLMTGLGFDPTSVIACFVHGLMYYAPILIVTFAVGGFWEVLFAAVRKHEVNEGFFVTGMLIPMLVPATIPLWQVALATSFGIVIGKEVFGGVGYNILNPALTARAFLFFAYAPDISGNSVWVAVDGYSAATPLALAAEQGIDTLNGISHLWYNSFMGYIPGSLGETSVAACLIGAFILIVTGVASWRIMISVVAGAFAMSTLFNAVGSETNPMMAMPFEWHLVLGGFAFGTVFMATDPVTAPVSNTARIIYGFLIGVLVILVRTVNPAYPEGMMLSILLMNVFAPLIDYYVVKAHKKKRMARYVG